MKCARDFISEVLTVISSQNPNKVSYKFSQTWPVKQKENFSWFTELFQLPIGIMPLKPIWKPAGVDLPRQWHDSSPFQRANDARRSLIRIRAWSSRNFMTSHTQTKETRAHFSRVSFGESLYTSYRCQFHNIIFWQNFIEGFLFFNQKYEIARFLKIPWIYFHFFKLKYCPKSFKQDCRLPRYFTEANSRKGSK